MDWQMMDEIIKLLIGNSPLALIFLYYACKVDKRMTINEFKQEQLDERCRKLESAFLQK